MYIIFALSKTTKMNSRNRLKDEEGLFNELDTFFSDKEELIAEGFYSLSEFREAVIETILEYLEDGESE